MADCTVPPAARDNGIVTAGLFEGDDGEGLHKPYGGDVRSQFCDFQINIRGPDICVGNAQLVDRDELSCVGHIDFLL